MPKLWQAKSRCILAACPTGETIGRAVPCSAHAVEFAESGQFTGHRNAANVRNVDPYEVDESFLNQGHILGLVNEEFAHGNWGSGLLAHDTEVAVILRRERIFQEEEVVRFECFRQAKRLHRRYALMHVVEQLHTIAQLVAQVLEEPRHLPHVRRWLPVTI